MTHFPVSFRDEILYSFLVPHSVVKKVLGNRKSYLAGIGKMSMEFNFFVKVTLFSLGNCSSVSYKKDSYGKHLRETIKVATKALLDLLFT